MPHHRSSHNNHYRNTSEGTLSIRIRWLIQIPPWPIKPQQIVDFPICSKDYCSSFTLWVLTHSNYLCQLHIAFHPHTHTHFTKNQLPNQSSSYVVISPAYFFRAHRPYWDVLFAISAQRHRYGSRVRLVIKRSNQRDRKQSDCLQMSGWSCHTCKR